MSILLAALSDHSNTELNQVAPSGTGNVGIRKANIELLCSYLCQSFRDRVYRPQRFGYKLVRVC
jgi:hypothetical protein